MGDKISMIILVAAIMALASNQFLFSSKKIVLKDVRETRTFTSFIQNHPNMDILNIKQDHTSNLFTIEYVDRNTRILKTRKFKMSGVHMIPLNEEEL